jgi:hypothetical protein
MEDDVSKQKWIDFYNDQDGKLRVEVVIDLPVIVAGFVAILGLAVVGSFLYYASTAG